jgi:neuronal cell adhesion protein
MQVIQSGSSSGLQNKHEPVEQYLSRRNDVAFRGKEMKLWCIYGGKEVKKSLMKFTLPSSTMTYYSAKSNILGTPLPEIRWRKQGGALPWGRTTYDNYGKTLVLKHVDFEDAGQVTRQ